MSEAFMAWPAAVQAVVRALLLLLPVLMLVPGLIWWERRLLSWMQDRIGPNRVGPFGLLQPIADGVKLFMKEDITPSAVDRAIYFIAPAVALFPAFAIGGTMPWGPNRWLTPVADVNIGVLYILAISSLGVYGIVLGGYAANNKYSLMGGLRSSAQLISYELAMGMSLACIVLATGSLKMTDMVAAQEGPLWGVVPVIQNWFLFTPYGAISFVIFVICMIAETNRAPFDLPEAENELIAGYHTEYSSMKFAVFFMGEYAAMMLFGGILSCVFLGGHNFVPINWDGLAHSAPALSWVAGVFGNLNYYLAPIWFLGKCAGVITFYIWLRATLPRLRYDQLMNLGWKTLLPLATANFVVVALWILATRLMSESQGQTMGSILGFVAAIIAGSIIYLLWKAIFLSRKGDLLQPRDIDMVKPAVEARTVEMVDPNAGVA